MDWAILRNTRLQRFPGYVYGIVAAIPSRIALKVLELDSGGKTRYSFFLNPIPVRG